jgi:xylulokinase
MDAFLGLDVGTSATKAVLCDSAGKVLGVGSAEHPTSSPRPGWSEQDPEDWWGSSIAAVRAALAVAGPVRVRAAGLSGQMHGSVLLDAAAARGDGSRAPALRPALLWNDQRTAEECRWIEDRAGGRRALVELTGNAALTGFTLPKVIWVRRHEPDLYTRIAALLLPKDYVRFRMTGMLATDVGDAAGTLLFDVERRSWSPKASSLFEIDPSVLPPILESAARAGTLTGWAAAQLGLESGIPIVAGSGDNQAGAVGAGVVTPGCVLATLGTSGVIYAHAERPRKDLGEQSGRVHTMCAANGSAGAPGQWSITGCMLCAGGSLRWCRDTVCPGLSYSAMMNEAAAVAPGSGGLVFLPYLTGERCPYPDPSARGGWIGLTARHTRGHLIRSVVEGVSFAMGQVLDLVRGIGVQVDTVRVGGGGARSALWRQMLADVFDTPVATTNTEEGPAYGAALLAGVGAGLWPSVSAACAAGIGVSGVVEPGGGKQYAEPRTIYADLYHALRPSFAGLGGIDRHG